jgi:excisionase family DNA binding protein
MSPETYYTAEEAAAYLRSSPSTLAKLRLHGGGPIFTRIGRVIRYRRSDLDRWMSSKLARSTSDTRLIG